MSGRPSFEAVYTAELDYVAQSLRRLGASDAVLEDLTHDVFMSVLARLPQYDPARPLRPWLFGIAFRVASAWRHRASTAREQGGPLPEVGDPAVNLEEQVARDQARSLVLRALDAVDADQRAVFVLHELDGWRAPEIAEALAIPLNTAYSRLRLARQRFNAAFEQLTGRKAS